MDFTSVILLANSTPFFLSVFFCILFLICLTFFCMGWKLASYKNRDKWKWAFTISISGFYGIAALALLPKQKEGITDD